MLCTTIGTKASKLDKITIIDLIKGANIKKAISISTTAAAPTDSHPVISAIEKNIKIKTIFLQNKRYKKTKI